MLAPQRAAAWPARRGEKVEDRALCPPETVTQQRRMEQGHPNTSRHGGPGPQAQRKTSSCPGTLHTSALPHKWPMTQLTGSPTEQGQGVPARHRDSAATSGTSTVPRQLGLSRECGEPLSSQGLHAGGWQATAHILAGCQGRRVQSSDTAPPFHTMTCLTARLPAWRKWPQGNNTLSANNLQRGKAIGLDPPPYPITSTPAPLSSTQQDTVLPRHCCGTPQKLFCPGAGAKPHSSAPEPAWLQRHLCPGAGFLGGCLLNGGAPTAKRPPGGAPGAG